MNSTKIMIQQTERTAKTPQELRYFGLTMALILSLFSVVLYWRGKPTAPYFLLLVIFFAFSALIKPTHLRLIEIIWTRIGEIMGVLMTPVILSIMYYLIITPLGLLTKLLKKDLLSLKLDCNAPSYWIKVEKDGPGSRHDTPY